MRKRIAVVTDDKILYNKIRLLLRDEAEVSMLDEGTEPRGFDIVFSDGRYSVARYECIVLGRDIPYSFRHEDIFAALESADGKRGEALVMANDKRCAYLFGEEIRLTEVEYKLLGKLLSACPEFVSREELLATVWGGECDTGVVNVYIYYLRQKLEKSGSKVIISSRSYGYKIDEKYGKRGRG